MDRNEGVFVSITWNALIKLEILKDSGSIEYIYNSIYNYTGMCL